MRASPCSSSYAPPAPAARMAFAGCVFAGRRFHHGEVAVNVVGAQRPDRSAGAPRRLDRRAVFTVGPLLLFMIICFNLPMLLMLGWSISNPTPTLQHYVYLFRTPVYLRVVGNTVEIAVITTLVCVALGYPLAYWARGLRAKARMVVMAMVLLPFWISILIRTYAWIVVLGNAGLVNRLMMELGLVGAPVHFLYSRLGVTIGTVNVLLPFFVLPVFAAMTQVDERLLHAAQSLGASRRTIFRRVFLPLTVPSVVAGSILVFILTLGFYITPAILGGGRVPMAANMLDMLINQMPRWELAAAISTLLMVTVIGLYMLSGWVRNRGLG
jgi:putative spermidine/putrescine transport system permease protein